MAGAERRIPGEGLMERMEARSRRRPRIGMSPAFYTRLGLEDPWAPQGESAASAAGNDGMVFLSAAPYHAMMEKLAASRRRRERRAARFVERRAGTTLRAAARSWPGEGRLPTPRIASLALESMRLPEAPAPQIVEVEVAGGGRPRRRADREPVAAVETSPWAITPFIPARVIRGGDSAATHAGQRLARAVESREKAAALADLPQRAVSAVARSARMAPVGARSEETVEVVRRTRLPRPVVRYVEESVGAAADAPVARASRRGTQAVAQVARAPAARSPSFQMASAAYAAEVDRAAANSLAAPERGESMRPAASRRVPPTQRASGRADRREATNSLSASPVSAARVSAGRPLSASPVQSTSVSASAGARSAAGLRAHPASRVPAARAEGAESSVSTPELGPVAPEAAPRRTVRASSAAIARMGDVPPQATTNALPPNGGSRTARLERSAAGTFTRPVRRLAGAETMVARPDGAAPMAPNATGGPVAGSLAGGRTERPSAPSGAASVPTRGPAVSLPASAAAPPSAGSASPARASSPFRAAGGFEAPAPAADSARPSVASATRRAAQRAVAVEHVGSLMPQVVQLAPRDEAPRAAPVRRGAAVRLAEGSFAPASVAAKLSRSVPEMLAPQGAAPLASAGAIRASASPVSTETSSPALRGSVPAAGARNPEPAAVLGSTSASRRAADRAAAAPAAPAGREGRVAAMQAVPTAGWAAARGAGAPASGPAHARSALPRLTASAFTLPASNPVFEAESVIAEPAHTARRATSIPAAAPVARRPEAPVASSALAAPTARAPAATAARAPTSPRIARPGSIAQAVSRGGAAAPAARKADPMRRTGPLSWARPAGEAELVASFTSRPGRTARVAASPTSGPAAAPPSTARGLGGVRAPATRTPDQVLAAAPQSEVLAELSAAGLVQSNWSPSTPVRTPDGRYISARVAERIPGLAILPAVNGPVAISTTPVARSAGLRTPDVRFVGAPSAAAASFGSYEATSSSTPAARSRPTDWVSARTAVTEATAFRGAMAVRSPNATFVGSQTSTTPDGQFVGARRGRAAPGIQLRGPEQAPESAGSTPRTGAIRPRRASLETTLADVSSAQPQVDAPMWAARSDGAPQVRSAQGLFQSLARATTAEQVVNVIAARAGEMTGPVPLTEPMRAVVEQIRQELRSPAVAGEGTTLRTRAPEVQAPETTVLRPSRSVSSGSVASTAAVRSGASRPVRSSAVVRSPGGSDDRVSKLVKRLTDLIHLAENERRLTEAQRQVRMAEDTAAARAEGSAPAGSSSGGGAKLDIETFAREVLEVVNRELELRRERRSEDGDEQQWW